MRGGVGFLNVRGDGVEGGVSLMLRGGRGVRFRSPMLRGVGFLNARGVGV